MAGKQDRFLLLDGMRGVAAIAVMLMHLAWQVDLETMIFPHAYLAVDFFFMLSGFVIASAYEGRLASGAMSFAGFCRIRLIRLYPMILLGAVIGVAVGISLVGIGWWSYTLQWIFEAGFANLILVPWVPDMKGMSFGFPLNSPMWSLFWELLANAVAAVWIIRCKPDRRHWLMVTLFAAVLLIGFGLTHNGLARGDREWAGGLVRIAYAFNAGFLIHHWRHRIPALAVPIPAQIFLLVAILACPNIAHVNALYDVAVALFLFPAIIAIGWRATPSMRTATWCVILGDISYPLYALHYPFVECLRLAYETHHWSALAGFGILAALVIIVGAISYGIAIWVDAPVRNWLRDRTASPMPLRHTI